MAANASSTHAAEGRVASTAHPTTTTALGDAKMRRCLRQTTRWLGLYLLLSLSPLIFLSFGAPLSRGFWTELAVGLGAVGFAMMALQSLSVARFRAIAPFFGSDAILLFHRQMGIIAFLFVLAHPLLLFGVEPRFVEYLDPRVNFLRAIFLSAAAIGIILLVVLPLLRESVALRYEWWRLSHAVCAAGVLLVGLVHGLQVGHYIAGVWKQGAWVALFLVGVAPILHLRLVRPWLSKNRAYRVEEMREEHGDTTTLVLRPEGHDGIAFKAGQFSWLTLGKSPFRLDQHPFSLTGSAATRHEYQMSVKALGDFTSALPRVPLGTRAYLDGPHGSFSLGDDPREGAVLIMGGIGITPAMSMLRTSRDWGDRRSIILIYANDSWEDVAFREELDAIQSELNLRIVHVLDRHPEGWQGEKGLLRDDVLERHLPPVDSHYHYFVCGPPAMMAIAEKYLVKRGIPPWNRSVERFDFV
jgi:predicted ferric reductase